MRFKLHMSMNHIAEILGRSTATIHRVIQNTTEASNLPRFDNRGGTVRRMGVRIAEYQARRGRIKTAVLACKMGLAQTVLDAFAIAFSPAGFGGYTVSENSADEEALDPS